MIFSYLSGYYRLSGAQEIHLTVCTDTFIRKINKKFLKKDRPTDVIVFDLSDTHGRLWGDMLISSEMARMNSRRFHTTYREEFALYCIHAFLHLLGHSDHGPRRNVMKKEEEKLLALIKKKKLI